MLTAASARGIGPVLSEFRTVTADTASAMSKNRGGILHGVAAKLMHRGRYQDAADVYRLAIDLSSEPSWAHSGLGEANLMSGKRAPAAESFRKALASDSTNTVAYEYLRFLR